MRILSYLLLTISLLLPFISCQQHEFRASELFRSILTDGTPSPITHLSPKTFEDVVTLKHHIIFVLYYSTSTPQDKQFPPHVYLQSARALENMIPLSVINCDDEAPLCNKAGATHGKLPLLK